MNDQHGEQNQQPPFQEVRQGVNLLIVVAQIMCKMAEVVTRWPGSMGERYLGIQAVISWVVCYCWVGFFPGKDPRPMMLFWFTATVCLVIHRIAGVYRRRRGYVVHSLYVGAPILVTHEIEFVFVLVAGLVVVNVNYPLGSYLIASAIGLWISGAYMRDADKAKLRAMRDARLENEWLMQQQNRF